MSAKIELPYNLQSPPASALSVVGGHCDATSPGSVFRNIFCWGPSVAQTQGDQKPDGTHVTTVTSADPERPGSESYPECPRNVFRADLLKLTLESTYPTQGQPSIVPTPTFGRMFLNDQEITLSTDHPGFLQHAQASGFR